MYNIDVKIQAYVLAFFALPVAPLFAQTPSPSAAPRPTPTSSPPPQVVPFGEDFEGEWQSGAPVLWRKEFIAQSTDWEQSTEGAGWPLPPVPHGGSYDAQLYKRQYPSSGPVTRLISPRLIFPPGSESPRLIFWFAAPLYPRYGHDVLKIFFRSAQEDWTLLAVLPDGSPWPGWPPDWEKATIPLPIEEGEGYVCFEGNLPCGVGILLDDVLISPGPTPSPTSTPPTPSPTAYSPSPSPPPTPAQTPQLITIESGDYDGDGDADPAVFHPATGRWAALGGFRGYFGGETHLPASGDFNGDGTSEVAVFIPSDGTWAVLGLTRFAFGGSGDIPAPCDYDGDGTAEGAFFRASTGLWRVRALTEVYFGQAGDIPVPADYSPGDGRPEIAVFRPSTGQWLVRAFTARYWGTAGDIPVPADYDRDGTAETAIYRPSTGLWAGVRLYAAGDRCYLGSPDDYPVPAVYEAGNWVSPAVFRPSTGLWAIRYIDRLWFGASGDIPVSK